LAALNQSQQNRQPTANNSMSRDFFNTIMQQAIQQSLTTSNPNSSNSSSITGQSRNTEPSQPSALSDETIALGLEKMHDFGFWDDEKNIRALNITEGNVEAAISLLVDGIEI
jgi:hypothetical protein